MQWYVTSILVFNQIIILFLLSLKWNEYVIKFSINQANYENIQNSLKIPISLFEFVYRRSTDNTMAKRKFTKGQTTIYKTYI